MKIHLTMKVNFVSSKDSNEKCLMHSKRSNRKIMNGFEKEEIIQELFNLLLAMYQIGLKQLVKGVSFAFDYLTNFSTSFIR